MGIALLKPFWRSERGATAVEFAMVGPVFFAILFSMIETGWMMAKTAVLDEAVAVISRQIYTGQAPTKAAIEAAICEKAFVFHDCVNNINVEITPISAFSAPPTTDVECLDSADTSFTPAVNYATGSESQTMFMRVCITTDVLTPGLGVGLALGKTSTGRFQLVSSTAFQNEPF
ncbi:MAG: TadE/TadG family type IV pilus assembly protein [Pseudomonadota bacterium]